MLVEDLIRELEKLPKNSTIGVIDIYECRVERNLCIVDDKDIINDNLGDLTLIEDIVKQRKSNKDKLCDYYII